MTIPYNVMTTIPTIAMDSGKFNTRLFAGLDSVDIFRTKIEEIQSTTPRNNTIKTEDGKMYLVGNDASNIDHEPSKETLTHKLCIYYGLIRNGFSNRKINLAIGTPIKYFKDPQTKKSYADFIRGNGNVEVEYNGVTHNIMINEVLVLPEGCGILYANDKNYNDLTSKYIGIIDIGGLNAQGRVYQMGTPLPEFDMDSELGTHTLSQDIADKLNMEDKNARYSSAQIESLIERHYNKGILLTNEKDILAIKKIEICLQEHLASILRMCQAKKWNLEYMDIMFTGGGAQLLRGYIESKGFDVSDNCIEDNVRGFYDLATNYFASKGAQ